MMVLKESSAHLLWPGTCGWLTRMMRAYLNDAQAAYRYGEGHIRSISAIGIVANLMFYPLDLWLLEPAYDTFYIRLLGSLFCVPLVVARRYRPDWVPLLYWFAATYLLYSFCIAFLLNAASVARLGELAPGWMLAYVVTLFLYMIGMNSPKLTMTGWIVTALCGIATVHIVLPAPDWQVVHEVFIKPMGIYATAVIFGTILLNRFDIVAQEKTAAARAVGGTVAHELRTPIASMSFLAQGALTAVGQPDQPISEQSRATIATSLSDIIEEAQHANTIIDMVLINTSDNPDRAIAADNFTVAELVQDAVARYPFVNQRQRDSVVIEIVQDFAIVAPRILLTHVLFNLLKNALFHVERVEDAKHAARIRIRAGALEHCLVVEDNGPGIAQADQRMLFERFYTTSPAGTGSGIGLTFCAKVMESVHGNIWCESTPGVGSKFWLRFDSADTS